MVEQGCWQNRAHAAGVRRVNAEKEGADGDAHAPALGLACVPGLHEARNVLLGLGSLRAERCYGANAVEYLGAAVAGGGVGVGSALFARRDGDFEEYHDDHNGGKYGKDGECNLPV